MSDGLGADGHVDKNECRKHKCRFINTQKWLKNTQKTCKKQKLTK